MYQYKKREHDDAHEDEPEELPGPSYVDEMDNTDKPEEDQEEGLANNMEHAWEEAFHLLADFENTFP